jgi:predicted unusual protein kinase regulating ubiquinone biosynthesis (AarF/ABC1/UbiB family)
MREPGDDDDLGTDDLKPLGECLRDIDTWARVKGIHTRKLTDHEIAVGQNESLAVMRDVCATSTSSTAFLIEKIGRDLAERVKVWRDQAAVDRAVGDMESARALDEVVDLAESNIKDLRARWRSARRVTR